MANGALEDSGVACLACFISSDVSSKLNAVLPPYSTLCITAWAVAGASENEPYIRDKSS